jgi:hypothetical protein
MYLNMHFIPKNNTRIQRIIVDSLAIQILIYYICVINKSEWFFLLESLYHKSYPMHIRVGSASSDVAFVHRPAVGSNAVHLCPNEHATCSLSCWINSCHFRCGFSPELLRSKGCQLPHASWTMEGIYPLHHRNCVGEPMTVCIHQFVKRTWYTEHLPCSFHDMDPSCTRTICRLSLVPIFFQTSNFFITSKLSYTRKFPTFPSYRSNFNQTPNFSVN